MQQWPTIEGSLDCVDEDIMKNLESKYEEFTVRA
jgi:hypothetical protein